MLPRPSPRRRFGSISARRFSKPSAVTRPPAVSSHSASSTSLGRRRVARTRSAKNEAPRAASLEHFARRVRQTYRFRLDRMPGSISQSASSRRKERNRRDARGTHGRRLAQCRMRRKPRPHDLAGEAELIQILRAVLRDAPAADIGLPMPTRESRTPATGAQSAARRPRHAVACPARRAASAPGTDGTAQR